MKTQRELAEEIIQTHPEWYHSIELAPGVVTPGRSPIEVFSKELSNLRLPDLHGKSVLDIGAYDGFFSFAAEQMGAARVTALDHYVWSADMAGYMQDWRESRRTGTPLPPPHESRYWQPDELPGRRPFDAVRSFFDSKVKPVVGDFMTMDLADLGQFDVVFFLGVLYHLEDPLGAMRRVMKLTAPEGLAIVETAAMEFPELPDSAFCEFLPGRELNNDPTNWWIPNAKALEGLCVAAGFREVTTVTEPPKRPWRSLGQRLGAAAEHLVHESHIPRRLGYAGKAPPGIIRYRAIAHAHR